MNRRRFKRAFNFPSRTRARVRADVREEFAFHLDMRTAELVAGGMSERDARAQAEREFGDRSAGAAAIVSVDDGIERRRRVARWIEDLRRDSALGWRLLLRSPGLSIVAILTLALGIGANAAIFSMFEQTLLRPLPVPDPASLVNLASPGPKPGGDNSNQAGGYDHIFSYPMFQDLERISADVLSMAAHRAADVTLTAPSRATSSWGMAMLVSGSYFPVLRLTPAHGRLIGPTDDDVIGDGRVAVLSSDYWRRELGADPNVVGQTLLVNGQAVTIVGVAPASFTGTTLGIKPSVFVPITLRDLLMPGNDDLATRRRYWVYSFARLKPGVTIEQASAAINVPFSRILNEVEAPLQVGASDQLMARFRAKQVVLSAGSRGQSRLHTALLTPFALLLVRAAARAGEMAVRLSIGGGRWQLVRQLFTESCVLAAIGGAAGLAVANWTLDLVATLLPRQTMETVVTFGLDVNAMMFAAALTLGAAILCGLAPALHATRADLLSTLKDQSGQPSGARAAARFRTGLATAQIALAMTLLVSAGLFVRSLMNVSRVDLGLNVEQVVSFAVAPAMNGYPLERTRSFLSQVEDRLAVMPGVTSASASLVRVLADNSNGGNLRVQGFNAGPDTNTNVRFHSIGATFFDTVGMRLVAGRKFAAADGAGAPKVAIVNEAFVKKFELERTAIGTRLSTSREGPLDTEIVGIVRDAKYSAVKQDVPAILYRPYLQSPELVGAYFYARTTLPPEAVLAAIPPMVSSIDPAIPVRDLMTLPEQVRDNVFLDRLISLLSASFATLATLMAALGLYGVLAYTTAQRTREFGLRMALGADPSQLRRLVLWQVARMTLVGGAIGLAAALGLGAAARSLLYGLEGYDPLVVSLSVVLLMLVAFGAGLLPALRASRINPVRALRWQ